MGDNSGKDLPRPGQQPSSRTLSNVHAVQAVLDVDRRATVCQLSAEAKISTGSVHQILKEDLQLWKKSPKFVPCVLTEEQKQLHVHLCRQNLQECQDPLFLWSVITGDDSWFSVLELEQKPKSMQWLEKGSLRPKKVLRSRQAKKMLMEIFFDDQGIVHPEFLPPKMTVTSKVYVGILACLHEAIQRKRPALWSDKSFRILHDNAPGHTANHTVTAMMETDMKEVSHPPYSPDLAPVDFWFFPLLKSQIRGKIFASIPELQDALVDLMSKILRAQFHDVIHKQLPDHWRKCIQAKGEYFEGDHVIPASDSDLLESSSSDSE